MIGFIVAPDGANLGFGHSDDFAAQIAAGATVIQGPAKTKGQVWDKTLRAFRDMTAAEKLAIALARAQHAKGNEIEHAFEKGSKRDVVVDGVIYGGGMTSALLIDGTTRKNRGRGQSKAKVWSKGNRQGAELTVEQAENVSFEITAQVERDYETLQTLLNTVETATTVEAVEAIDIPSEWQV